MTGPRRIMWAGHVTSMRDERNVCKALLGKPEVKRPPGRSRYRWKVNIKIICPEE
jgi:hypothetical protein